MFASHRRSLSSSDPHLGGRESQSGYIYDEGLLHLIECVERILTRSIGEVVIARSPIWPSAIMDTASADDVCPVCKSSRYMNPKMKFLVNPECYHRMCSSCVDRIFAAGRAKCPIAKCHKMLRKGGFRAQIFEDVRMEKEKDIREEVASVFNKREEDFEDLRAFNDYLEAKEDICFGLCNGVEVEENRKKLNQYKEANKASIAANLDAERDAEEAFAEHEAQEREMLRLRREAARREEEDEQREQLEGKRQIVSDIAGGKGDAAAIARQGEERLKRSKANRANVERQPFVIQGLKKPGKPEPEKPYDPFGGYSFEPSYFPTPSTDSVDWYKQVQDDTMVIAGGYDLDDYCKNLLTGAFAGLGVFVGSDMTGVEATG